MAYGSKRAEYIDIYEDVQRVSQAAVSSSSIMGNQGLIGAFGLGMMGNTGRGLGLMAGATGIGSNLGASLGAQFNTFGLDRQLDDYYRQQKKTILKSWDDNFFNSIKLSPSEAAGIRAQRDVVLRNAGILNSAMGGQGFIGGNQQQLTQFARGYSAEFANYEKQAYVREIAKQETTAWISRTGLKDTTTKLASQGASWGSAILGTTAALATAGVLVGSAAREEFLKQEKWREMIGSVAPELSGGVLKQFQKLGASTAMQFGGTIENAQQAQYQLLSSGLSPEQTRKQLPLVQQLSRIGLAGGFETAGLFASVTQASKQQGQPDWEEKLADTIAFAMRESQLTIPQLAEAWQYVAPQVASRGMDPLEMIRTVGFLNTRGLQGSMAGVGLGIMQKDIEKFGARVGEFGLGGDSFVNQISRLATRKDQPGFREQVRLSFEERAERAFNILIDGAEQFKQYIERSPEGSLEQQTKASSGLFKKQEQVNAEFDRNLNMMGKLATNIGIVSKQFINLPFSVITAADQVGGIQERRKAAANIDQQVEDLLSGKTAEDQMAQSKASQEARRKSIQDLVQKGTMAIQDYFYPEKMHERIGSFDQIFATGPQSQTEYREVLKQQAENSQFISSMASPFTNLGTMRRKFKLGSWDKYTMFGFNQAMQGGLGGMESAYQQYTNLFQEFDQPEKTANLQAMLFSPDKVTRERGRLGLERQDRESSGVMPTIKEMAQSLKKSLDDPAFIETMEVRARVEKKMVELLNKEQMAREKNVFDMNKLSEAMQNMTNILKRNEQQNPAGAKGIQTTNRGGKVYLSN